MLGEEGVEVRVRTEDVLQIFVACLCLLKEKQD